MKRMTKRAAGVIAMIVAAGCGGESASDVDAAVAGGDAASIGADAGMPGDAAIATADAGAAELCAIAACGGDVVGRWELTSPCAVPRPAPVDDCGGGQNHFTAALEGTLDLRADGTVTIETRRTSGIASYHPVRCLPAGAACESFFRGYDRCTTHDGFCDCVQETVPPFETSEETYRVAGSELTFVEPSGDEVHLSFCARDGTLRYSHEGDRIPNVLRRLP